MPQRKLPDSAIKRTKAMQAVKNRLDAVPAPLIIPLNSATITRFNLIYPDYMLKIAAREAALQAQSSLTGTVEDGRPTAEIFITHFYQALQNGIKRKVFNASVRSFYGLAVSDANLPRIKSEADIIYWGGKAAEGEAARIAAGGTAIPFPTIAEVNLAVANFKNPNVTQASAKEAYDAAQEAVEAMNEEVDKLILKMWNEIEATFDEGDKPSMRRKAREWGVVYVALPGEAPSPDDFSLVGKVTDTVTGAPLAEAAVYIESTGAYYLSETNGNYYVPVLPAGTYNFSVLCNGYKNKDITGVVITAGVVTTLNIQLEVATTGNIQGNVAKPGAFEIANVSLDNGMPVFTDGSGNYTLADVPAGTHEVKAWYNSNPGNVQTQTVDVTAGSNLTVNFNF